VLTIVDPESLEVQVELSERRIGSVREGDRAVAFLDADPDNGLAGTVRKIWPRADRSKGSIEVRVRLTKRPPSLRPEMAARVVFKGNQIAADPGEPYVTVPAQAVARRGGSPVVFVVEAGVAVLRRVDLGPVRGQRSTVEAGLSGGEVVVLNPPLDLEDGARIQEQP
jgi:RND family efflux transporter MFP subunit